MKKNIKIFGMAILMVVLMTMTAMADENTEVRAYPGWNGAGPKVSGPISGTVSDEEWSDYDDDDDDDSPYAISYAQGWRYNPDGWWFQYSNGTWPSNEWRYIDARWYRFTGGGHIITGWYTDGDGNKYYLNPVDDGTFGSLRTGWQVIDKKVYYFNPKSDGYLGRLLTNTTTPDGYQVGADGAMLN